MFVIFTLAKPQQRIAVDLKNIREVCEEVIEDKNGDDITVTKISFYRGEESGDIFVSESFDLAVRLINNELRNSK